MKHYLLTFNQDYADEHNVPALACFTKDQYEEWYATDMIYNRNENYELEMIQYQEKVDHYNLILKLWQEKGLMMKYPKEMTAEETAWVNLHPLKHVNYRDKPSKGDSRLHASLGNSGECFGDGYEEFATGREFVEANIVKVMEVSEDFYNTFHKAKLDKLSLCNIFEVEELGEYDDDEDYNENE